MCGVNESTKWPEFWVTMHPLPLCLRHRSASVTACWNLCLHHPLHPICCDPDVSGTQEGYGVNTQTDTSLCHYLGTLQEKRKPKGVERKKGCCKKYGIGNHKRFRPWNKRFHRQYTMHTLMYICTYVRIVIIVAYSFVISL